MKLQKFDYQIKDNRKNKSFIILGLFLVALVVGVVLYKTFAVYTTEDSYNIIKGTVGEFTIEPLKITYNLVGEDGGIMSTTEIPSSEEYKFDDTNSSCINGNTIAFNESTNTFTIGDGSEGLEDTCNIYFNFISLAKRTLYALGYNDSDIKTGIPYGPNGTNESGFYEAEDDYGTSYYFYNKEFGDTPQFFVNDYSYYLVRINGNGSIRLLNFDNALSGTFNEHDDDNMYVGYMFGVSGNNFENVSDSLAKTRLENYYNNIDFTYLDDVIFCNDRSLYVDEYGEKEVDDLVSGLSNNVTYYGSYYRIKNNMPSLKCVNKDDAFTKDDEEKGNGKLSIPVGLLTADEAYMMNQNVLSEYFWGTFFNTMSPAMFKDNKAQIYVVDHNGLIPYSVSEQDLILSLYHVINLKSGLSYIGDGFENPYEIAQ